MAFIVEEWYNKGENEMRTNKYRVIRKFKCCGDIMVIVKMKGATHIMTEAEWKRVYGILHSERWKDNVRDLDNIKTA